MQGRHVLGIGVLVEQPVVKDAPGDGRGAVGAKTGILHHHGQSDFGVFGGCKGNVQSVVALMLIQPAGIVFFVTADAHGLRCPCFSAAQVARPRKGTHRGALFGHADHGVADDGHVFRGVAQVFRRAAGNRLLGPAHRILGGDDEFGFVFQAVIGQNSGGLRQLQHGEVVVTLANTERNGFAGVPFFQFRAFVGVALPFLAGQHTTHFAVDIDAGDLPKAQRLHEVVHRVDAELVGQRVVVHIARFDDAAVHVHRAQTAVAVAAKGVAAKGPRAGVVDGDGGRALATLQSGHRHEGLVGGAGRVGAAQGAVEQRLVDRLAELFPALRVDPFDKQIGVERGLADKSQHLARFRVQRHDRAAPVAKHLFNHLLQLDVDGQNDGVTGCGGAAGQFAHGTPCRRGFKIFNAGDAMQAFLKTLLNAELADVIRAPVIAFVFRFLQALFVGLVDPADVADHVAGDFAKRVVAIQPRLDVHPRKSKTLGGKDGDFGIGQTGAYRQGLQALGFLQQFFQAFFIARMHRDDFRELFNDPVQIAGLGGRDLQGVGRVVGGQHDAIAVQDQTPVRHDGNGGDPVVIGLLKQVVMAENLQVDQPGDEQQKGKQHQQTRDHNPPAKTRQIDLDIS